MRRESLIVKLKEFLKPNWRKIVIFVVLLLLSYFYTTIIPIAGASIFEHGFPLPFYKERFSYPVPTKETGTITIKVGEELLFSNLLINIVFYYFLSCLIVWVYDKMKKKITPNRMDLNLKFQE